MRVKVPDVLCIARLVLAPVLLVLEPLSDLFLAVYTVCCLTDVLDGMMARRFHCESSYGQALDSISDAVLAIILLVCLIPNIRWEDWMIIWIAFIAVIRVVSLGIGTGRYGKAAFVHTYLNKLAGLLLFLAPFLLRIFDTGFVVMAICSITTVSALEYLYINCTSEQFDREYGSIFLGKTH